MTIKIKDNSYMDEDIIKCLVTCEKVISKMHTLKRNGRIISYLLIIVQQNNTRMFVLNGWDIEKNYVLYYWIMFP